MFYYYVWVRSNRYHGTEPLTYACDRRLAVGTIVEVALQKNLVLGFVSGLTTEPKFQTKAIARVFDMPPLPLQLIKLVTWVKDYYPAPLGLIAQQLLPDRLTEKQLSALAATKSSPPLTAHLPPLTEQQSLALEAMSARDTYLLHGTTGSGKTRLYIELALQAVAKNRSAIVLTPEISLTTQLAGSFQSVFQDRVIVMHSRQTPRERLQSWLSCLRATEPMVVIGPRSALFAPLSRPGLIVLDEAHESAYKQEQAPHYHASRVASYLATQSRATLVFGSATPSVNDYFLAEQKIKPIIKLTKLAQTSNHPPTEVVLVDRKDHGLFNRSPYLSQPLIASLERALSRNEQSLLYLNRRGTARLVLCENCGWQALCPNCDIPLTYHGDKHQLRCHSCNYGSTPPTTCPSCNYASIVFKTAGTKAIMAEVERLFPNARAARFDTDNLKSESFEANYQAARDADIDILIGTQMLAKGLDLPKLSTVGILLADTSLYLPDFSAQERTFQLINQVLGRIGRGHVSGQAVIQTYAPEHPVLEAAIDNDFQRFYEAELISRKQYMFPPFCYLLKLTVRRATIKASESAAFGLKQDIISQGFKVIVEGPAPSFYERQQGKYQWQLVVKAVNRPELLKVVAALPANWSYDIDPIDLL